MPAATSSCPCGGGRYHDCCGPLHRGERRAATPEQLMRARFSAFARADGDFLYATWHPHFRRGDAAALGRTARGARWTRLDVLDAADDTVRFIAWHVADGRLLGLRERSRFLRDDRGRWLYADGDATIATAAALGVGRNDPCPCRGAGPGASAGARAAKFKRCCGRP